MVNGRQQGKSWNYLIPREGNNSNPSRPHGQESCGPAATSGHIGATIDLRVQVTWRQLIRGGPAVVDLSSARSGAQP